MPDTQSGGVLTGCSGLPPGLSRPRYFSQLRYLETAETFFRLPAAATMRKWRGEVSEHARFGLVAPRTISHRPGRTGYKPALPLSPEQLARAGGFRDTDVVREAVDALADAAAAVTADTVVFRSPPELSPSSASRDTLRRFFGEIASADRFPACARVWYPDGLWEPRPAARFASELGVVYGCDPLVVDPLDDDPAVYGSLPVDALYMHAAGLGRAQNHLDEDAMEILTALAELYKRVWIVFSNPAKYPDSIKFQRILDDGQPPDEGD